MITLADHLDSLGFAFEALSPKERQQVDRRWLETFAQNVRRRHKRWVHRGFRWHGFSYELQPCVSGTRALEAYHRQWACEFYLFDEKLSECLRCARAGGFPDLSELRRDAYVAHHNMKWTMVFTHEHPDFGPYFAVRDDA